VIDDSDDDSSFIKKLKRAINKAPSKIKHKHWRKRVKRKFSIRKDSSNRWDFERKYMDGAMKQYVDDQTEAPAVIENESGEYFLAATCLNDHYISKILDYRVTSGLETVHAKQTFVSNSQEWVAFVRKHYLGKKDIQVIEFGEQAGMVVDHTNHSFIDYTTNSNSIEVKIYGSQDYVNSTESFLNEHFTVATCYIEWVYASDGSSVNIPLLGEKLPISEMYPFLGDESVDNYYQRFLESSASILLLIGPPGTGKTTFIRGLLHYAAKNAIVTYDESLLQKDYVFARFIEDDAGVMVIEDADNFLKSRNDGNSMMHRFLNVGDGLITIKGKKLVFSTNLPSTRNIDPALIRPGRCFDILEFRNYNEKEALQLAKKLNINFAPKEQKNNYSLAEIFHQQVINNRPTSTTKMGFI